MKKILFTGGGSAGHVLPNLALMEEFLSTGEADVCYMGTNGIEKDIVSKRNVPFYEIECPKLIRGGGWKSFQRNLGIPKMLKTAKLQALKGLEIFKPDLVFSKGGYVALPVVSAAKKLGIPCLCHESDLSLGLANRLSAPKCERCFTSFPETAKTVRNGKYSGAPLRRSLFQISPAQARKQLDIAPNEKVLLIFGGGSGSVAINNAVRKHLKVLTAKYSVLHVCGKGNTIKSNVKNYRQFEFVADMGAMYNASDLIVARAGSGTVFEIVSLKKPSVLIPLEGETRGDQWENAEYFFKKGLCRILPQNNLDSLPKTVDETLADKTLKENLLVSHFTAGNDLLLREIRAILHR